MTPVIAIPRTRHFWLHYAEMFAAMMVGMMLFAPLWWPLDIDRAELTTLVMATDMTIGMAVWMRIRGHHWRPIAEMSAAMYVPFVLLFPPLWAGMITEDGLMMGGHLLMLLAMLVAMVLRPAEYAGHHH